MKKIAMSFMTIAAVLVLIAGATRSAFSDNATSYNNTFSSGTLDLKLSDADEGWSDAVSGTWNSPASWAPGDEVDATLHLYNSGTVSAEAVYANWNNLRDPDGLSNVIEVTWLSDSTDPTTNNIQPFIDRYDGVQGNHDGVLSLAELVAGVGSARTPAPNQARFYADFDESYTHPVLPAGGTFDIKMKYKFMESAGNEYQGKTCQFDLTLQAAQHHYTP